MSKKHLVGTIHDSSTISTDQKLQQRKRTAVFSVGVWFMKALSDYVGGRGQGYKKQSPKMKLLLSLGFHQT